MQSSSPWKTNDTRLEELKQQLSLPDNKLSATESAKIRQVNIRTTEQTHARFRKFIYEHNLGQSEALELLLDVADKIKS
ncbi:hypothetical protein [Thioclava sp. GXIMD4215]|uniref:hypothetical protein n=1 Tax=Thioclava sp. GXIMD4215 TaxID=3131928 RepID=UPI00311AFAD1